MNKHTTLNNIALETAVAHERNRPLESEWTILGPNGQVDCVRS